VKLSSKTSSPRQTKLRAPAPILHFIHALCTPQIHHLHHPLITHSRSLIILTHSPTLTTARRRIHEWPQLCNCHRKPVHHGRRNFALLCTSFTRFAHTHRKSTACPHSSHAHAHSLYSPLTADVSMNGHNCVIIIENQFTTVDGTSASAPYFAAFVSLMNDIRLSAGNAPLGFLNPFIYNLTSAHFNGKISLAFLQPLPVLLFLKLPSTSILPLLYLL
jgi:hypothetical protein